MSDLSVKVGVRIRPLLSKERHQNNSLTNYDKESIEFKNQTFTYDNVFGLELSQQELYQHTAAPMLKSFLDGFNVTIIAYGQTGSGKTYTMGTADNETQDPNNQGLVPRFVCDLFDNIDQYSQNEKLEASVKVSFLEIYGEDVYDLSGETANSNSSEKESLYVRENDMGHVFVQGLHEATVHSSAEALSYLNKGTHNRITASTNMNAGSSRSHAVFTITLNQTMQSSQSCDDTQFVSSKLTFVDLAGSERIKRTGAEGQRLKEGIQINSGLFNLGQVINGLADDQRIKNGTKASHIPYRNSKLTHLLKDALGGNSQTLFLACVSPAESNESETFSTLSYARQARNIKNKPLRNVDKQQMELRRLKYAVKTWMTKAVFQLFSDVKDGSKDPTDELSMLNVSLTDLSSPLLDGRRKSVGGEGSAAVELFKRPEVQHYIQSINDKISAQLEGGLCPSPRKVRLSVMPSPRTRTVGALDSSPTKVSRKLFAGDAGSSRAMENPSRRRSVEKCLAVMEGDSEDTEQLVSRMIELVNKEKDELLRDLPRPGGQDGSTSPGGSTVNTRLSGATSCTEATAEEEDDDSGHMALVEREIEEKEEILGKLMDAVRGFGTMKHDYESLLHEINSLEVEKIELEKELENIKKQDEALAKNKKAPVNQLAVLKLKERFTKVQNELASMKSDRQKKESAYRVMQRESKQCEKLQEELRKMKETKVALMRAQKTQSLQAQKMKKDTDLKLGHLKKIDVKKQRQMNTLKSELVKKQRVLGHKDREIGRIQSKLKASELHIQQLININTKKRTQLVGGTPSKDRTLSRKDSTCSVASIGGWGGLSADEKIHMQTSKGIIDSMIIDRVDRQEKKMLYERKTRAHKMLNEELAEEVVELQALTVRRDEMELERASVEDGEFDDYKLVELRKVSQEVITTEDSIDKITHELNMHSADIDELYCELYQHGGKEGKDRDSLEDNNLWEELGRKVIEGLNLYQCQAMLWDMTVEKSDHLNKIEEFKRKFLESKDACESATETIADLENELQHTKNEMKTRLDDSEKQRVNDLWDIMKSNSSASTEESKVVQSIAITRAQELESALQSYVEQESELKAQVATLRQQNEEIKKRAIEASFVQGGSGSAAGEPDLQKCFTDLKCVWESLGTPADERESILTSISCASKIAQSTAVMEAQKLLHASKAEEDLLTSGFEDMCGVLDIEEGVYFNEEVLKTLPLLERVALLKDAYSKAEEEMSKRSEKVYRLKSKLEALMADMNTAYEVMSFNLQRLLRFDDNMATAPAHQMASAWLKEGVLLSLSYMSQWDSAIRDIAVQQVNNINQTGSFKKQILSICKELNFSTFEQLSTVDCGCDEDTKKRMVDILLHREGARISGDETLLHTFEKMLFVLQTIRANRKNCLGHLQKLAKGFHNYLQVSFDETDITTDDVSIDYMEAKFRNVLTNLPHNLDAHVQAVQIRLVGMVTANKLSASEYDKKLEGLSESAVTSKDEIAMLNDLDEPMSDLEGLSLFIEEVWLSEAIASLSTMWKEKRAQAIFAIVLGTELNRFNIFADSLRDIKKFDNQLIEQVTAMEDFEGTSKQNRQKVLSGSSKALVEEEKYRKNGKRKYGQISEKLVQAARTAQQHSDGMQMDISHLSQQGQDLLRGKIQERIELMHLHTTTHGTKRWSGDKMSLSELDSPSTASNDENVINNQDRDLTKTKLAVSTAPGKRSPPQDNMRSRSKSPLPSPRHNASPSKSRPKTGDSSVNTNIVNNKAGVMSTPKDKLVPRVRIVKKEQEGFVREPAVLSHNPFNSLLNKF